MDGRDRAPNIFDTEQIIGSWPKLKKMALDNNIPCLQLAWRFML